MKWRLIHSSKEKSGLICHRAALPLPARNTYRREGVSRMQLSVLNYFFHFLFGNDFKLTQKPQDLCIKSPYNSSLKKSVSKWHLQPFQDVRLSSSPPPWTLSYQDNTLGDMDGSRSTWSGRQHKGDETQGQS